MEPSGLSIQLRPDGLSFACGARHETSGFIARSETGFEAVFANPRWPQQEFERVWACVPTQAATLIPAEFDRVEEHEKFFAALEVADNSAVRILAHPVPGGKVLLHGVCEAVYQPLTEKYGDKITFFHPLAVNLGQQQQGTILRIDLASGIGNCTLNRGEELLFADVFPLADEAALLLAVNRIVVAHKLGAVRIVCSGEHCTSYSVLLGLHYRDVSVHADRESRDLFFPLQ